MKSRASAGMARSKPKGAVRSGGARQRASGPGARAKAGAKAVAATPASRLIDQRIRDLGGWRGETLARMRALVLQADPEATEEVKWRGTPVWSRHGIICTGEAYAEVVKLTFARGARLADPARLFNSSLEGSTRRAIDLREGERIDAGAFRALVRRAVAENAGAVKARSGARKAGPVRLLAGGNPQIAKGEGDAPVQAYLAALPGWKGALGRRLDALIARSVPGVRKAVKWNSPFYGVEGRGWFLALHAFTHHLKLTFFKGASLRPLPPGESKSPEVRHLDLREADAVDEAQVAAWVRQAAALPGWTP